MCDADLCLKTQKAKNQEEEQVKRKVLSENQEEEQDPEELEEEEEDEEDEEEDNEEDEDLDEELYTEEDLNEHSTEVAVQALKLGQLVGLRNGLSGVSILSGLVALSIQGALYFASYLL